MLLNAYLRGICYAGPPHAATAPEAVPPFPTPAELLAAERQETGAARRMFDEAEKAAYDRMARDSQRVKLVYGVNLLGALTATLLMAFLIGAATLAFGMTPSHDGYAVACLFGAAALAAGGTIGRLKLPR